MVEMATNSTASYATWEEVSVSSEKGRRQVQYYLRRIGGGRDLVVVGKEKSIGRISYRYKVKDNDFLLSILNRSPRLKLRTRGDVIDWLNSIVSDERPNVSPRQFGGEMERELDDAIVKDVHMPKFDQYGTEFTWLGSPWTCRKRRRHYQSFCRNGAVISGQEFVYVLAEENKRLVAYLEDMYEDARGSKMVVVRWFHKIDEVGFVLPRNFNDREIFFSLCLQDLSIECIDGLATVLSPEHYEKYCDEATRMGLVPFVCYRQFDDDDDVKPFDITSIKGYSKQEIFKNRTSLCDAVLSRPSKRIRLSNEYDLSSKLPDKKEDVDTKGTTKMDNLKDAGSDLPLSLPIQDKAATPKAGCLTIGSEIEVLSQDSGIRGCWFRASIIKKRKDKVKVQYNDIKDAVDDSKKLEEWILSSRIAAPDAIGIRLSGRSIVRPTLSSDRRSPSVPLDVGNVVDAWWHDGWWEGIVVKKEPENQLLVYFPGERHEQIFSSSDLRHSKEWFDNRWQNIKERPDIVLQRASDVKKNLVAAINEDEITIDDPIAESDTRIHNEPEDPKDLSKHYLLARLRWGSSGKRRGNRSNNSITKGLHSHDNVFVTSSLNFDSDNCKYASDPHFSSSVVSSLSNLVMSR